MKKVDLAKVWRDPYVCVGISDWFTIARQRRLHTSPWTAEIRFYLRGKWVRIVWGVTFKPERFRKRHFGGHTLLAVRLWGKPLDSRLVALQWCDAANRGTVVGTDRRVPA